MGLYIIAGLSICLKELRQQKQRTGLGIAVPLYVHRRATVGSVRKVPEANVIHVNWNGNIVLTENFESVNGNWNWNWKIYEDWNKTKTNKMKTVTEKLWIH